MFSLLFGLEVRAFTNRFRNLTPGKLVRLVTYLFVIAVFLASSYGFFFRLFRYLFEFPEIGRLLSERLLGTAFLVFFTMLYLSNIITSLSTFYHSPEVEFLLAQPIKPQSLFQVKFLDNAAFSSWATMLLVLPLIVAVGVASRAPWFYFPLSLLALPFYVLIPAALGVLTLLLLRRAFPRMTLARLLLLLAVALGLSLFVFFKFGQPSGISIKDIQTPEELGVYLRSLGLVAFPFLPSTWMGQVTSLALRGRAGAALPYLFVLFANAAFALLLCSETAQRIYFHTWTQSLEARSHRRKAKASAGRVFPMPRFLAVMEKDLTVFLRSPTQWAQGVIILALLAIYMGSLHNYPQMFDFPFWKVMVSFINFAFVAYNMSVLSTRFVFPSMSLEGRTLWFLRSAPLSPSRLLLEKIALSLVTSLILGEFLIVVSNFLLKAEAFMLATSAVGTLVFAVSLSFLSVSLGALFPDFKERNPGRIASGPGGILCAMACLGLVAITVALVAWPTYHLVLSRANQMPFPLGSALLAVSGALLLNALAAGVPFSLAVRNLGRRDY